MAFFLSHCLVLGSSIVKLWGMCVRLQGMGHVFFVVLWSKGAKYGQQSSAKYSSRLPLNRTQGNRHGPK